MLDPDPTLRCMAEPAPERLWIAEDTPNPGVRRGASANRLAACPKFLSHNSIYALSTKTAVILTAEVAETSISAVHAAAAEV